MRGETTPHSRTSGKRKLVMFFYTHCESSFERGGLCWLMMIMMEMEIESHGGHRIMTKQTQQRKTRSSLVTLNLGGPESTCRDHWKLQKKTWNMVVAPANTTLACNSLKSPRLRWLLCQLRGYQLLVVADHDAWETPKTFQYLGKKTKMMVLLTVQHLVGGS